jgi:hypothetical protein
MDLFNAIRDADGITRKHLDARLGWRTFMGLGSEQIGRNHRANKKQISGSF